MHNEPHNDGEVKTRWVRTSVEMLEHPILDKGPYCRRAAWLWLIASAAWKTRSVRHKGTRITLERGQVLIGRSFLAETWGWSEQNVRTFLNQCMGEGMLEINQSTGHYANVATICNYDKYQSVQPVQHREYNQSLTSAPPISNQTLTSTNITSSEVIGPPGKAEQVAASGPDEISGLNGSTKMIVEQFAGWLNPWSPDLPAAHKSIADAVQIYGSQAVRDGFADLKADHADGKVRAMTVKAFYGFVRTAKERGVRPAVAKSQTADERSRSRQRELLDKLDAQIAAAEAMQ